MPYSIPNCVKCDKNVANGGTCTPDKDTCRVNSSTNNQQVQYSDITSGNYSKDDNESESQYMCL